MIKYFLIFILIVSLCGLSSCGSGDSATTTVDTDDLNYIASSLGSMGSWEQTMLESNALAALSPAMMTRDDLEFTYLGDEEVINGITGGWYQSNEYDFLGLSGYTYVRYEDENGDFLSQEDSEDMVTMRDYNAYTSSYRTFVVYGTYDNIGVAGESYTYSAVGVFTFTNNTEDTSDDFVVSFNEFNLIGQNDNGWIYESGEDGLLFSAEDEYVGTATINSESMTEVTFTGTVYEDTNANAEIDADESEIASFSIANDGTITITPTDGDAWDLAPEDYPGLE